MKKIALIAVAAAFAIVGSQAQAAGDVAAGQKSATQKCATCHDMTSKKQNKVGPYLWGISGAALGKVEGFKYSENHLKAGGEIKAWDDANLDKYLEAPAKVIPNNKMAFAGLKDAAERANVIEFLKTLK
ncbi:MAG: c-type cytochrome [Magnetococcales bacterium]|nr:c-type cytochrome [Magnetococcales bacterium]